jgi:hypothetical protein
MEKNGMSSGEHAPAARLSLAEEQRRAFEEDQRRPRRKFPLRWPGFLFRN